MTSLLSGLSAVAAEGTRSRGLDEAQARFAQVGTHKVHYKVLGAGSATVVLVHCWAGNLDFWRAQVPALEGQARLLLLDLPGHGKSDQPQTAYSMEFFARGVAAVMRDAKADKAVLMGHSMGVAVISRFYRDYPDKVQALVAVDGSLRGYNFTREQFDQFVAPFRGPDYRTNAAKFIDTMFPVAGTEALRERIKVAMLTTPQHVMVGAFEGMFDRAAWELNRIEVPLLVIHTPNPVWSAEYAAHVRQIAPQVEYQTIPDTGHWLMLEKPEAFNRILVGFLRQKQLVKER